MSKNAENTFTSIPNEILEATVSQKISATDIKIVLVVARQTYGWHKLDDAISLSQFIEKIGGNRSNIIRRIKELVSANILVASNTPGKSTKYYINPQVDQWKTQTSVSQYTRGFAVQELVAPNTPTKEKTKETLSKTSKNSLLSCTTTELETIAKELQVPFISVKNKHAQIIEMIKTGYFQREYPASQNTYDTLKRWLHREVEQGTISQTIDAQLSNIKEVV